MHCTNETFSWSGSPGAHQRLYFIQVLKSGLQTAKMRNRHKFGIWFTLSGICIYIKQINKYTSLTLCVKWEPKYMYSFWGFSGLKNSGCGRSRFEKKNISEVNSSPANHESVIITSWLLTKLFIQGVKCFSSCPQRTFAQLV